MSQLRDIVTTHYRGMETGDLDLAVAGFDPAVVTRTPKGSLYGLAEFRGLVEVFCTAAPDGRHEIVNTVEAGDTIVVEGIYSGTHTGPLMSADGPIAASGATFSFPYADVLQVRDGKVVTHSLYWDNMTFLGQLGLLPGPIRAATTS
jgi:predicted ester cyclase